VGAAQGISSGRPPAIDRRAATIDSLLGEVYTVGLVAAAREVSIQDYGRGHERGAPGLVYQMKNKKRQGVVEGNIDMSMALPEPRLERIEFAWNVQEKTPETPFAKGGLEVQPHPMPTTGSTRTCSRPTTRSTTCPLSGGRSYLVRTMIFGSSADTLLESSIRSA